MCIYTYRININIYIYWYISTGMEYRIRMIILMVRMMAIGAIILEPPPKKEPDGEYFSFAADGAS